MNKICKTILCSLFSVTAVFSSASCSFEQPSKTETVTSAQSTTTAESSATADNANKKAKTYNYVKVKQDSDVIQAKFDNIVSDNDYKGTTYCKIGNDFEYINSSGDANADKHIDNSIDTCYYTGSITKQFTAAAVLKLCEEKKLKLSDTIDKFFPSYSEGKKITIKNLLTMTSGIKNYLTRNNEADSKIVLMPKISEKLQEKNSENKNKDIITKWILSQDLLSEPDTCFIYSDSNYYLLGEIIEKTSGKSYESYLKDSIFVPFEMDSTGFDTVEKTAVSYPETDSDDLLLYSGVLYSSMGLVSNISDLLKWIDGLFDGTVINEDSLNQMFTPYKQDYAMGLFVNGNKVSHSGRTENYNSMISFSKDKSEIFISLSNYAYSDSEYLYRLFENSLKKYIS